MWGLYKMPRLAVALAVRLIWELNFALYLLLCVETLHSDVQSVREIFRVLKPEFHLYFLNPNFSFPLSSSPFLFYIKTWNIKDDKLLSKIVVGYVFPNNKIYSASYWSQLYIKTYYYRNILDSSTAKYISIKVVLDSHLL